MKKYKKIAFVGLDGVPCAMLQRLFELGAMPYLEKIARQGVLLGMETSLPPVSSVAWTSFMTASNPGDHGIFGFTDIERNKIALKLPSFDDIQCPTLWNRYPEKKALIVNLPFTYPARPLNGKLICGFVAPVFERAVYPESLIPWLKSQNYAIDTDNVRARQDRNILIRSLFDNLNCLQQVSLSLLKDTWDILVLVITGTDRLHHFLFEAFEDESHPHHSGFISYYQRIDSFLSAIDGLIDDNTLRVFLSDHGFTNLKTQIYLNNILKALGYLRFAKADPKIIDDIHPDSQAFAMDPTRIYINTLERFGNLHMPLTRALETRARLKSDLEKLKLSDLGISFAETPLQTDEKVFCEVKLREEVYTGRVSDLAPDLVVIPQKGFDVKATINATGMSANDIFTGMHAHDDAFLLIGDPDMASRITKPHIEQVARLLPWAPGCSLTGSN